MANIFAYCDLSYCNERVEVDTLGGTTYSTFVVEGDSRVMKGFCCGQHLAWYEQQQLSLRPTSSIELLAQEFSEDPEPNNMVHIETATPAIEGTGEAPE